MRFLSGVGLYVCRLSGFGMPSKGKNKKLKPEQDGDAAAEGAEASPDQSGREILLQKE